LSQVAPLYLTNLSRNNLTKSVRYSRQHRLACDKVNHGRDTLNLPLLCSYNQLIFMWISRNNSSKFEFKIMF